VHLPTRVAVLDQRFVERIVPWPGITTALVSRSARRAQWLARHLAILENPRVDARLLLLFWQLADRWGTVRADGVTVPFQFTHTTLGRLVRAQRPSVTASLHELSERGLLTRRQDGRGWTLHGDPDLQLRLLHDGRERT
jgi:CRP-like cAMP-binding protein